MGRLKALLGVCCALLAAQGLAGPEVVPFGVRVNGIENRYAIFSLFELPGAMLTLEPVGVDAAQLRVSYDGAPLPPHDQMLRVRMPPEPGAHLLEIRDLTGNAMRLNVFVMWTRDASASNVLNGYRIGSYPLQPLKGLEIYEPPTGFVEVTAETAAMAVSPNFRLGEFVCKQSGSYPKYLVLRPQLLQKLELLLAALNAANQRITSLTVMSGYRTPEYNEAIGNGQYSRHVWGGAADVFIDSDNDGRMDDLDGDGRVSRRDSEWLARFVDQLERRGAFGPMIGGVGTYGVTETHGPFVHIDARGFRARW